MRACCNTTMHVGVASGVLYIFLCYSLELAITLVLCVCCLLESRSTDGRGHRSTKRRPIFGTKLSDAWSANDGLDQSPSCVECFPRMRLGRPLGRPMAAALGRPTVDQKIVKVLLNFWSTAGTGPRTTNSRAKTRRLFARPLVDRGPRPSVDQ